VSGRRSLVAARCGVAAELLLCMPAMLDRVVVEAVRAPDRMVIAE
jgi:hypothetical protein